MHHLCLIELSHAMQSDTGATAAAQALAQAYTQGILPGSSAVQAMGQHMPRPAGLLPSDMLAARPPCAGVSHPVGTC